VRLLFVGNSYTARNDLPRIVAALGGAASPPLDVQTKAITAGGASLRRHWNGTLARPAIAQRNVDVVVLQEQSTLPIKNPTRYHENVRLFDGAIRAAGARTALYLTWSRRDAPQTQAKLDEAVEAIAAERAATIVPVGRAWHAALRAYPEIALYTDDGSHPTPAGSYLAGCVFARVLLGVAPEGTSVARRAGVDEATALRLQAIADACSRRRST
jgi:hypothetical protein